jgi:hypothetical protein
VSIRDEADKIRGLRHVTGTLVAFTDRVRVVDGSGYQ